MEEKDLGKALTYKTMPPIMANSNKGQDYKDKCFDTSRRILSQQMTICNMEAPVSYFSEIMTNVNFQKIKLVKCQGQKVKYQHKDHSTRDIHKGYSCEISKL